MREKTKQIAECAQHENTNEFVEVDRIENTFTDTSSCTKISNKRSNFDAKLKHQMVATAGKSGLFFREFSPVVVESSKTRVAQISRITQCTGILALPFNRRKKRKTN